MNYRDLELWQLARALTIDIHRMTIKELPKFELYEQGSQIRRSMKLWTSPVQARLPATPYLCIGVE
jgi:hypothetical protein